MIAKLLYNNAMTLDVFVIVPTSIICSKIMILLDFYKSVTDQLIDRPTYAQINSRLDMRGHI